MSIFRIKYKKLCVVDAPISNLESQICFCFAIIIKNLIHSIDFMGHNFQTQFFLNLGLLSQANTDYLSYLFILPMLSETFSCGQKIIHFVTVKTSQSMPQIFMVKLNG